MKAPRFLNAFTHSLFINGFWLATKKPIKLFYKKKLNVKLKHMKNPLKSKDLKLIACS